MEHDQEPTQKQSSLPPDEQPEDKPAGCGMFVLKIIAGIAVLFVVAVALVFGVCLMA